MGLVVWGLMDPTLSKFRQFIHLYLLVLKHIHLPTSICQSWSSFPQFDFAGKAETPTPTTWCTIHLSVGPFNFHSCGSPSGEANISPCKKQTNKIHTKCYLKYLIISLLSRQHVLNLTFIYNIVYICLISPSWFYTIHHPRVVPCIAPVALEICSTPPNKWLQKMDG